MFAFISSRTLRLLSMAAVLAVFMTSTVFAYTPTPYGRNVYGTCVYGCANPSQPQGPPANPSPPSTPTTTTQTPSGLEVAINLSNGQVIPSSGYTITVTPLNGQGSSFQQVDIYIDGVLVATVTPGADGTAHWDWDPAKYPGTDIKIVITDNNGGTVTKEYTIKIGNPDASSGSGTGTNTGGGGGGGFTQLISDLFTSPGKVAQQVGASVANLTGSIVETATNIVRALPAPVVYGFPYFLLLLLLVALVLLVMQGIRELREYHVLQALVRRGRAVADSKKTLAQLVSHYLRTPLTLMMGGVDALGQDPSVQAAAKEFEKITSRIHLKIEGLIGEAIADTDQADDAIGHSPSRARIFRQQGMFLPLILLPGILIPFNYLAVHAGAFTISQTNLAAQIIIYLILMTLIYIALRRVQLSKRDKEELQRILVAEEAINQSRDKLISQAADTLEEDLQEVDGLLSQVSDSDAKQFIKNGQDRYKDMVSKLKVAMRLKGARTQTPYTTTTFSSIVTPALQSTQAAAAEHGITISQTSDEQVNIQSPELVSFVLQTLVDNAIAYSKDKSSVELGVTTDALRTTFTVTDHGQGIEQDKLPLLFQPFSKAEGAEVFTHEGMGFNLYLDKLVADYLGGTIDVESKPNEKTTISLSVPHPVAQQA